MRAGDLNAGNGIGMTTETKPAQIGGILGLVESPMHYRGTPLEVADGIDDVFTSGELPNYIITPPILRDTVRWRGRRMVVHRWPRWFRALWERAKREAAE